MNAEIVSIGSELLLGQIVDTNASWIAQRLAEAGVNLFYKTTVGDNMDRMVEVLDRALDRSDVVVTGGGIGPTQDDLTREAIAKVTGRKVVTDPGSLLELRERFQKRGFILTKNNERQAQIPDGAIVVRNPNGTAPAFIVETDRGVTISLPGVPFEMKWLVENEVIPYLREKFGLTQMIHYRILKVADLGESAVDDRIGHLIAESANPTVGVLAHPGQVDVRIAALAKSIDEANGLIDVVDTEVRELLGDHIFGVDDETIESVIGKLVAESKATVATCEDLSGGAVAAAIQEAAGPAFLESAIANTNDALEKIARAGGENPPFEDGAERAAALARAIRQTSGATYGIAVHGVEEGDQRTENLGRGETYIVVSGPNGERARHVRSAGRGAPDRRRAAMGTLSLFRRELLGISD
ncbi:MAG: CinA family nicotinamide mononucleotide deamidase-related protein [Dehalococcoidia bacterium]|jgi:nicotinamide-nucleotide amidase|nr:CinA family nicotinamide mononucleotide deamidase-related protein [Dehalococcoidia bacterium]|tara:strand:- start:2135 stop:3370 length:1236 start_codon:yes stop_codon:yes gene_type:complete